MTSFNFLFKVQFGLLSYCTGTGESHMTDVGIREAHESQE